MFCKRRIKHCAANHPHLFKLRSCLNHITHPCFLHNLYPVIPHHDHQDPAHSQSHPVSPLHKSNYLKHPQLDHSKIQKSHLPFPFPANEKTQKRSFTRASFTSTVALLNLVRNKTRSLGSCHTCKPVRLEHGKYTSWLRYLKRLFGITQQTSFFKRYSDDSVTWINEPRCLLKFAP